MTHNLSCLNGHKLKYPHSPKWDERNNIVGVVTSPDILIQKGDIIFDVNIKPHLVLDILEERKAKGNHQVEFVPIFQSLSVELIQEQV